MRLDQYCTKEAGSRTKAQDDIKAGLVQVNGKVVTKPGFVLKETDQVQYEKDPGALVSRAGFKLAGAIEKFNIPLENQVVLDIGASTGGFTQCCLNHGARKVYALDVGHLQLDDLLKNDPRVVMMEGHNAREMKKDWFDEPFDFVCMDVSFISALTILESLMQVQVPPHIAVLVKPQFELGPSALNKNGIVKNPKAALKAVDKVKDWLSAYYPHIQFMPAALTGRGGNQEYVIYAWKGDRNDRITSG